MGFEDFFFAVVSLTIIFNPFSKPPVLISLTQGMPDGERAIIANRAVMIAWILGVFVLLFGSLILDVLSVRISSFQIFGGIMLLVFGIQFAYGFSFSKKRHKEFDVAAVPLASPLLMGPGAISAVMLLAVQFGPIITLGAMTAGLLVCLVFMWFSKFFCDVLNEQTVKVISRIMGMILVAFAVQFITKGLGLTLS